MLYRQNDNRIVTIDYVTSLHPGYKHSLTQAEMQTTIQQQQQPSFYGHYTGQPALAGTSS